MIEGSRARSGSIPLTDPDPEHWRNVSCCEPFSLPYKHPLERNPGTTEQSHNTPRTVDGSGSRRIRNFLDLTQNLTPIDKKICTVYANLYLKVGKLVLDHIPVQTVQLFYVRLKKKKSGIIHSGSKKRIQALLICWPLTCCCWSLCSLLVSAASSPAAFSRPAGATGGRVLAAAPPASSVRSRHTAVASCSPQA